MLNQKISIAVAAGLLAAGLGVASAFADNAPAPASPLVTTTASGDANGQQGVDEQGAANDVNEAANDVQDESSNPGADDQSGDQQDPSDQSEEQDDNGQNDDQQSSNDQSDDGEGGQGD